MIFFICIIVALVFFGIAFFIFRALENIPYGTRYSANVVAGSIFFILASFLVIAVVIMGVVIVVENSGTEARLEILRQQGEILEYQLDNDLYDNDNDIGKKELYSEIKNYNSTIIKGKVMQNDFWYGIFYPDIYDRLEPIDYKK